ncbi:hypothetical protein [Paractinoplanes maris]|uniref:hypothetical protein n=1 Tax=Paractinoplanes maris TaxID=1734446 RepID=UPI0020220288|nr:hypothetical protein [Actinoplanes maris]
MRSEILAHLHEAVEAAARKAAEAEAAGAVARSLLDQLDAAVGAAVRTLPPDTSVREVRRYVDERGRKMVEIEVDFPDDLAAYLDEMPDRNAFIEDALRRAMNTTTLGRHAYYQRLSVAAARFGLRPDAGSDLEGWMEHFPEAPDQLSLEILTAHADWVSRRPVSGSGTPRADGGDTASAATTA